MSTISVPAAGIILSLIGDETASASRSREPGMRALAAGLILVSFWTREQITRAFTQANRIWLREADIRFSPVNVSERTEAVPADDLGMTNRLINRLIGPSTPGLAVGFVHDTAGVEAGWGAGRIAVLSSMKARPENGTFAGHLLAHELGHILIEDPFHGMANGDRDNLMHPSPADSSGNVNAGKLNGRQVEIARERAQALANRR